MPLLLPRQNAPPTAAPPGVVIDYANPVSIGDRVVVSNVILGALALLFVLLRVLIKWRVSRAWGWEDCKVQRLQRRFASTKDPNSFYCHSIGKLKAFTFG